MDGGHGASAPLPTLVLLSQVRESQHTACAAISFKHHKELFSETLPRNLP
jgi:hypothetical protein